MHLDGWLDHVTDRPKAVLLQADSAGDELFLREVVAAFLGHPEEMRLIVQTQQGSNPVRSVVWSHSGSPVGGAG